MVNHPFNNSAREGLTSLSSDQDKIDKYRDKDSLREHPVFVALQVSPTDGHAASHQSADF